MKDLLKIAVPFMALLWFAFAFIYTSDNLQRGKALFNDPGFAKATTGKSCNSCHSGGKLFQSLPGGDTGSWTKFESLEKAVNFCVVHALKGRPVDSHSEEMANITSYIISLKAPSRSETSSLDDVLLTLVEIR